MSKKFRYFINTPLQNLSEDGYQSLGRLITEIDPDFKNDENYLDNGLNRLDMGLRLEKVFRNSEAHNEVKQFIFDNPKKFGTRKVLFATPHIVISGSNPYTIYIYFDIKGVSSEYDPDTGTYITENLFIDKEDINEIDAKSMFAIIIRNDY